MLYWLRPYCTEPLPEATGLNATGVGTASGRLVLSNAAKIHAKRRGCITITSHWVYFLRCLPQKLSTEQMERLDKQFNFTQSGNAEVLSQWLELSIRSNYRNADAALERFLTSVGRRKFLKPLYAALIETPEGKKRAQEIFAKARPGYHSVSAGTIEEMLR